jgi:hypothetical protein
MSWPRKPIKPRPVVAPNNRSCASESSRACRLLPNNPEEWFLRPQLPILTGAKRNELLQLQFSGHLARWRTRQGSRPPCQAATDKLWSYPLDRPSAASPSRENAAGTTTCTEHPASLGHENYFSHPQKNLDARQSPYWGLVGWASSTTISCISVPARWASTGQPR